MRRYLELTLVIAIMSALAAGPATASAGPVEAATAVLTVGSPGGPPVAPGDNVLGSGSMFRLCSAPGGGGTCIVCSTVSIETTALTNPAAPGTATLSYGSQAVSGCLPSSIQSLSLANLPYVLSISSSGIATIRAGAAGPVQITVRLSTLLGTVTCVYRARTGQLTGAVAIPDSSISFVDQPLDRFSGPAVCAATEYLTMKLNPLVDAGQQVYVN